MTRMAILAVALFFLAGSQASGQIWFENQNGAAKQNESQDHSVSATVEIVNPPQGSVSQSSPSRGSLTSEEIAYLQQMKSYNDPKNVVIRNAAFRGSQRRMRIASQQWYGYSKSRPVASPLPTMGNYSPMWAGSYSEPFLWRAYTPYRAFTGTPGQQWR